MPICPKCNASIHMGAESQCPPCGYSMKRADKVFGSNDVEFTRVVDEAGALTHSERMELMRALANLERHIPPVALCIYITDHGNLKEFRPHAHWILNHARIHHPSFGKREQMRAIEDAELRERRPGEARPVVEEEEPGWFTRACQGFSSWLRDICLPTPPPTRQEWMLILVLDVQLEIACFSWGYMLDPYVNPDRITSCIVGARLQFREREFVTALKKVMKEAALQLAVSSRRVNKTLRNAARRRVNSFPWLLGAGMSALVAAGSSAPAQEQAPPPAAEAPAETPAGDAAPPPAADVPSETPAETPAPPPPPAPPVVPGVPAAYNTEPRWASDDYTNLMSGRLPECYNVLMPGGVQKQTETKAENNKTPRRRGTSEDAESDTRVPGRYCKYYLDSRGTVLRDPQQLLTEVERADVMHVLRELNAHSRFQIYVSVFRNGQEVPHEIAATNLVSHIAQPGQYAVVLQYALGEPPAVEIGYKEIEPEEHQVRDWLEQVRRKVMTAGGGADGLLAGIRCLHGILTPVSESFTPLTPESAGGVKLIELELKPKPKEVKVSWKDEVKAWFKAGGATPYLISLGAVGAVLWGLIQLFLLHRSCNRLLDSEPDYRLASRYGAGVSRYVKYLEGKEADKEKKTI